MLRKWLDRREDKQWEKWERQHRWSELATYNGEVSRGIIHTPEWDTKMAARQQEYNEWAKQQEREYNTAHGVVDL